MDPSELHSEPHYGITSAGSSRAASPPQHEAENDNPYRASRERQTMTPTRRVRRYSDGGGEGGSPATKTMIHARQALTASRKHEQGMRAHTAAATAATATSPYHSSNADETGWGDDIEHRNRAAVLSRAQESVYGIVSPSCSTSLYKHRPSTSSGHRYSGGVASQLQHPPGARAGEALLVDRSSLAGRHIRHAEDRVIKACLAMHRNRTVNPNPIAL